MKELRGGRGSGVECGLCSCCRGFNSSPVKYSLQNPGQFLGPPGLHDLVGTGTDPLTGHIMS